MFKKISVGLVTFLACVSIASAGMVTDVVEQQKKVKWGKSYSYTHDLNDEGFVLGTALSGFLNVEIFDDRRDRGRGIWTLELSALSVENRWSQVTWGTDFATRVSGEAIASINSDGYLDVTIKSFWGDFFVGDSTLTVYTDDGDNPNVVTSVPEPGVLVLLGVGLVGLRLARPKSA